MTTAKEALASATDALSKAATITASSDNWQPSLDAHDPTLKAAADACARFIAEMDAGAPSRWLTLNGEAGCGKTMLARQTFVRSLRCNPGSGAIWVDPNQLAGGKAKRRPRCVWLDASEMAERMRHGEFDLPEYLGDDFLVVLDDLGAVRDKTDFMADAVYRLCQQRREGWTIFTTNLTMAEIAERVDERVASRLIRGSNVQVRITAGDYALRAKKSTQGAPSPSVGQSVPEMLSEPPSWRNWLERKYADESWATTAIALGWVKMPHIWRAKICREMDNKYEV